MEQKLETLCKVCGDKASGKHYGVASCDGCRGFFKRSIRRGLAYHCKESGSCIVDVTRRNQCQACRFKKCLAVNMKRDAVQHERAPRASLTTHCPAVGINRRHPYGYQGVHSGFLSAGAPVIDLPAYHFVYPQPTLPFHFGIKHHTSGLPNSLGLGIFNCPTPIIAKTTREMLQPHGFYHTLKRTADSNDSCDERTRRTTATTSVSSAEEDEVTSSEETRDLHSTSSYDTITSKPNLLDLAIPQGPESVYESAAKLLFLTVKWARSIPSFLQLTFHDQSTLLEDSWSELFVLSAAQWTLPVDEEYLVSGVSFSSSKQEILEKEAKKLKQVIAKFTALKVDHTEYACLKALTLFKTEMTGLKDHAQVEMLQDQTHVMLHDYCTSQDAHKTRFGKLLMLLPSVNLLSKDIIEELLFRKTIGNISIERVLSDMLKNNHNA
ncbi:hypothetical protein RUM43_014441 [Polyplax serrata]|uniref:Uncharacterized protein n=1 Tax=Polyplax serrata TaxID=468196 RepID=A0AAN8S2N3_POLSC